MKPNKTLTNHIQQTIAQNNGYISFSTFMELALFHPSEGYYQRPDFTIGKHGDFTTAPEISPLFAECLARQCADLFEHLPKNLLELGAGSGHLASDLLIALEQLGQLPDHYYIYEISPLLREKQQTLIKTQCPALYDRVTWLTTLPSDFAGIVFANEVLDVLPVHCFQIENGTVMERCVAWENEQLIWRLVTPTTPRLTEAVTALQLPNHYASEINLRLNTFLSELIQSIKQGIILFFDYGYGQREYYHPERRRGTLTCFYQHQRHDNPLLAPGEQDITAHVDFTRVVEIAAQAHCTFLGFTTQAGFLFSSGLMTIAAEIEKNLSAAEQVNLHHAIKLLTFPTEMGERVKVMALGKNFEEEKLLGFTLQDRRRDL